MSMSLVPGETRTRPAPRFGVTRAESRGRITSVPYHQHCSSCSPACFWWGYLPQGQTAGPWSAWCLLGPPGLSVKLLPSWAFRITGARSASFLQDSGLLVELHEVSVSLFLWLSLWILCMNSFRKGDKIKKKNCRCKCYSIFHKNSTRFCITVPEDNWEFSSASLNHHLASSPFSAYYQFVI